MQRLHELEAEHHLEIVYFDETGFSLTPSVPYAWQPRTQCYELPSATSRRINVLGFLSKAQRWFYHRVDGRVTTQTVIEAFDRFCQRRRTAPLTLVVVDNASTHRSKAFQAKFDDWRAQGVIVGYLPPYSPELNLIEILWRKIKYDWLPLTAYADFDSLSHALDTVLKQVGKKYQITFG